MNKVAGTSRVRFIMVEAEMSDGDIGQITQAIQNALRGPGLTTQRLSAPATLKATSRDPQELGVTAEEEEAEAAELDITADDRPSSTRSKVPRKPPATPKIILDVDLTSDVSLLSFAQNLKFKDDSKRFLAIAYWFKEHRKTDAVTSGHIYTCYRFLKWPTSISDFAQPLRALKFRQVLTAAGKGAYTINHLGIAEVEKLLSGPD